MGDGKLPSVAPEISGPYSRPDVFELGVHRKRELPFLSANPY